MNEALTRESSLKWKLELKKSVAFLRNKSSTITKKLRVSETGTVLTVGDNVARVYGLDNAMRES